MTSGPLPIRDDIFGFVQAFLTPRQGVDDNTNPKPPKQAPQNAAPGPQPTTGTGPADAPAPGAQAVSLQPPPVAPQPSGVRQVPEGSVSPVASPGLQQGDAAVLQQNWAWRMMMAQQEQARAKASEAKRWDTAMSGLAGLAGGLGGGSYAAGQAGFGNAPAPGSSRATGSDAFSLEEIRQFGDDATKAATVAANGQMVARFKAAHPEMNPADIDAAVAGGDYGELRKLGLNLTDPESRAKAATADEKVAKEKEFRTIMSNPETVARLQAATGVQDPLVLRALFDAGKLDSFLETRVQGTGDYQDYVKYAPNGVDPRTGLKMTYADYIDMTQANKSPTGGMNKELADFLGKSTGAAITTGRAAAASMPMLIQSYDLLRDNKAQVGGILGTDAVQQATRFIQGMNIPGLDMKGLDVNAQLKQGTTSLLLQHAKSLGANPTDKDAEIIDGYANGKHTNSQAAMLAMQRTLIRAKVLEQITANAQIDHRLAGPGLDPKIAGQLQQERLAIPDYTGIVFHPDDANDLEQAIAAGKNPAALKAKTDARYGTGMWDYYVANKHPELRGK